MANKMMKITSNDVNEFNEIAQVLEETILKMSTDLHLEYNKHPVIKSGSQITVDLSDFSKLDKISTIPGCTLSKFWIMSDYSEVGFLFTINHPTTSINYISLKLKYSSNFTFDV